MTKRLNLPFPSLESLREVWETQLRCGELFVPTATVVEPGDSVILSISAPGSPSSLDLVGVVTDQREVGGMAGLELKFEIAEREAAAIDAYAAGYWREAFVLLGAPVPQGGSPFDVDEPELLPLGYVDRPTPVHLATTDTYARQGSGGAVTVSSDPAQLAITGKTKTAEYQWPPPVDALTAEPLEDAPSDGEELLVEIEPLDDAGAPPAAGQGAMITKRPRQRREGEGPQQGPVALESAFIEIITAHAKMEAQEELHKQLKEDSSGTRRATAPPRQTGPRGTQHASDPPPASSPRSARDSGPVHGGMAPGPPSRPHRTAGSLRRSGKQRSAPQSPGRRGTLPARESGAYGDAAKAEEARRPRDTGPRGEKLDISESGPPAGGPPPAPPSRASLRNLRESGGKRARSPDEDLRRRHQKPDE